MDMLRRYRGSLLGLAVGDALGAPLEFKPPGTFEPIEDMIGGQETGLKRGQWTDDTSMALCLADSLIECKGFNPSDQLRRYVRWWREGYLSSAEESFGIGDTTRAALTRFENKPQPYCGSTDPLTAGNGSIMRLASVPLFYANNAREAIERSGESSKTTHGAITTIDACRLLGGLIVAAVNGIEKEEFLSKGYSPVRGYWENSPLCPEISHVLSGSFKRKEPPEIKGGGYVVDCLEAALWAFHRSESFREGCLMAANLGDDADTTSAVYGQLAGAYYGVVAIPKNWLESLFRRDLINSYAERLFELSRKTKKGR